MYVDIELDSNQWENVKPNFIYNRFDLMNEGEAVLLKVKDEDKQWLIPLQIIKNTATLGIWGMQVSFGQVAEIIKFIMQRYVDVYQVKVMRPIADDGTYPAKYIKNDFSIELPATEDELEKRLSSKGRNTIRRKKRIVAEKFGDCKLHNIKANEPLAIQLTEKFFEMKENNMGSVYTVSAAGYLNKYHVTDIYYMYFADEVAVILMSCEQSKGVYFENMTYNNTFASYSPGLIAYDIYLKELIKKGKDVIFLLGGVYQYKRRYGSVEHNVAEYSVVRRGVKSYLTVYGKKILIRLFEIMPKPVKQLYLKKRAR